MEQRRILVTGAAGFIGARLAECLEQQGHAVVGIDVAGLQAGQRAGFDLRQADYRDAATVDPLLSGTNVVFHLAAAHLGVSGNETHYRDVNVTGLAPFLEAAKGAGVERFVHVSSVSVYGDVKDWPADEMSPCRPQSIYGETKLAGERVALELGAARGLDIVIFRPAWVFGATCPRTRKLYEALRRGRFIMIGKGDNRRHPIYIDDAVEGLIRGMSAPGAIGEVMILGGPASCTARGLVETMCSVFGFAAPSFSVPYPLAYAAAIGIQTGFRALGLDPPVSTRTLEFFRTNNAFDISKSVRLLGYAPRFSLEEGLEAAREGLAGRKQGRNHG